jgi:tetratricopeptide (TPR) repeat protein
MSPRPALPLLALPALLVLCHCGGGAVEPAPAPRRPKAEDEAPRPVPPLARTDCDEISADDELPALRYSERSIEEGENLANQGFDLLRRSEDRNAAAEDRERSIEQAVRRFITALAADPYNVHATYNLAAAYARIGRGQCAVNLLERMVLLRRLPSQQARVEEKLDRLLGRNKWEGRLDPDFFDLRDDARFRDVVRRLQ